MAPVGEKGDRENVYLDQNDDEEEENLWYDCQIAKQFVFYSSIFSVNALCTGNR